ncbi:MAG: ABC transporter substrate-binding protein [Actinomycetales bacterium]
MRRPALTALVLPVLTIAVLAACGDTDTADTADTSGGAVTATGAVSASDAPDPSADAFPVTVASGDDEITIDARPTAVVSLSPTATESLFAVGAGDQVVAVDDRSDFPAEAPVTELSGFEPNVEAVLGYSPDLVLASDGTNDLVAGLAAAGVPTLLLPAATTLDEAYDQIEVIGAATGNIGGAAEVVAGIQADIDEILAGLSPPDEPLTYYHELDPTYFSVTSATFIGDVYARLGLENVADTATDPAADPYPQLTEEFIVTADPDLIFLADAQCCGVTPEQVAARPGWSGMTAVAEGRVHPVDEDVASRWGPRVVDFMTDVAEVVAEAEQPAEQPAG